MMGLTPAQARALDLVREYIAAEGVAPSMDDLREGLGLASKSGVVRLLDALQERGHIRRLRHRARSIELVGDGLDNLPDDALRTMRRRIDQLLRGRGH